MKKHIFFAIAAAVMIGLTSSVYVPVRAEEIVVTAEDETIVEVDGALSPDVIYEEVVDLNEPASSETENEIIVDLAEDSEIPEMEDVVEDYSSLEAGPISITWHPQYVTTTVGNMATFSVQATGKDLTYKWQMSKDNGLTWISTSLTGYNTNTLSVKATTGRNHYMFRCIIKDSAGNSALTSAARLTCNPLPPEAPSIVIRRQSVGIMTFEGSMVSFDIVAEGSGLTYRWQISKDGGSTWTNTSYSGYNTDTLSFVATPARNGYLFRCIIKDENGKSVTSKTAQVTLLTTRTKVVSLVTAVAGSTMSLHLETSETGSAYQWQLSKDGGISWCNTSLTGNNSDTLTFKATLSRDSYMFRCKIIKANGEYQRLLPVQLQIQESSGENTYTTKTTLTVRTGPDKSYSATGLYVSKGTKVTVYEEKNGWGKIRLNGREGWISLKPEYAAHDHTYAYSSSSTVPGICTDMNGITVYTCSCGATRSEEVPRFSHECTYDYY